MTFRGKTADECIRMLDIAVGHQIYLFSETDAICSLFFDILYVDHPGCNAAIYLESRMICLLSMLQDAKLVKIEMPTEFRQSPHVSEAVGYLRENCFHPDFRVGEVAERLGMNEAYLRKLFLQAMHISIRGYVAELRVQHAAELLKSSNYTVSQISEYVGYRDYRQFYAQFKAKTGKTPTDYRKV